MSNEGVIGAVVVGLPYIFPGWGVVHLYTRLRCTEGLGSPVKCVQCSVHLYTRVSVLGVLYNAVYTCIQGLGGAVQMYTRIRGCYTLLLKY